MKDDLKLERLKDILWGEYDKWYLALGDIDRKSTRAVETFLMYLFGNELFPERGEKCITKGFEKYLVGKKIMFPESKGIQTLKKMLQ